jgi:hypothetical protein
LPSGAGGGQGIRRICAVAAWLSSLVSQWLFAVPLQPSTVLFRWIVTPQNPFPQSTAISA